MTPSDEERLGDEIHLLHDGLLHWFYERGNTKRAKLYADLLESLLRDLDEGSILAEECRSLIAEVRGDFVRAIRHRLKEISLIRQLHELAVGKPEEKFVLKQYSYEDLGDRLDLLAILYRSAGRLDKAIAALEESKLLSETHNYPFDGADLLDEFQLANGSRTRAPAKR